MLVRRELIVHETRAEVTEEESSSIQAVFGAIVEDGQRTDQICDDIHKAVTAGRICLVLTQRTDHIDAIVDRLNQRGEAPSCSEGDSAARPGPR